jgi:hypothetical protein
LELDELPELFSDGVLGFAGNAQFSSS